MLKSTSLLACVAAASILAAEPPLPCRLDFQAAPPGKVPEGLLVLDGGFAVQAEGDARFLELPGAPLETYGVLFGPAVTNNVTVTARIFGTGQGRRFPTFAVGLAGASGYKLRVSPGKKALELLKGDAVLQSTPFQWPSGNWVHLRLEVRAAGAGCRLEGRAWAEGGIEPSGWMLTHEEAQPPRPGRASIWGAPFAGTPIRYDDLEVRAVP